MQVVTLMRNGYLSIGKCVQGWGHRFRATQAKKFINMNYFNGAKKLGNQDPTFITRISGPSICLILAMLQHALLTYESGVFQDGNFFNHTNSAGILWMLSVRR